MLLEDGEPKFESEFVAVQTIKVAEWARCPPSSLGRSLPFRELGSRKFGREALTSSSVMQTFRERWFHFTPAVDISPTLLRKIAKDIGLTAEQLVEGNPGGDRVHGIDRDHASFSCPWWPFVGYCWTRTIRMCWH